MMGQRATYHTAGYIHVTNEISTGVLIGSALIQINKRLSAWGVWGRWRTAG